MQQLCPAHTHDDIQTTVVAAADAADAADAALFSLLLPLELGHAFSRPISRLQSFTHAHTALVTPTIFTVRALFQKWREESTEETSCSHVWTPKNGSMVYVPTVAVVEKAK